MGQTAKRDIALLYFTGFIRSLATGLVGVILGVYLFRLGHGSTQIGVVTAVGLAGAAAATALITRWGNGLARRSTLVLLSLFWMVGGLGLALVSNFGGLLFLVFIGMVNAMGTDRSAAYVLEQSTLPNLVNDQSRTWMFSWYHLVLDAGGALGALSAAIPIVLNRWRGISILAAYQILLLGYAGLGLVSTLAYLFVSRRIETASESIATPGISAVGKERVYGLARLFAIDSFAGGFLTDALVAYWFFRRFGVSEVQLGVLFFIIHLLNALSHLGAAWLAKRIGLLKTMVFTHLPSSLFLIALPFAPSFPVAAALLLARESLVEMDVPTRQSYVAAVVRPHERAFAAGITNLSRNVFWAIASGLSGALMQGVALSTPLFFGGSLKIGYDIALYRKFRQITPPEERPQTLA
ncbi:MAG: MFS transporter [Acidobacteriales bacterium]|nr:MFS transporter [Terriglobales bacterium]